MTEDQLQEVFWGEDGWADKIYAFLKAENAAGTVHAQISIDMTLPESDD